MRARATRRACHARLQQLRARGLVVPQPFDAARLCERIGACLGHAITLVAVPMPVGSPYGLTLWTEHGHVIAYEERTSRVHQDLIIAHELGHVLFDHRAVGLDNADAPLLMPSLRPSLVREVLGRRTGRYNEREEAEAETMATILFEEASRPVADDGDPALGSGDVDLYQRLRGSLEHPDR